MTDAEIEDVAEFLWQAALLIEEGDLASARERLKQAQDRLEEAIRNGATDEEIAELMQELREAMDDYMRQLAEEAERNGEQMQQAENPEDGQTMDQSQLQEMLDEIQRLMEEGQMAEAQQLLEMLRQMMENMQVAEGQGQGEGQQGARAVKASRASNRVNSPVRVVSKANSKVSNPDKGRALKACRLNNWPSGRKRCVNCLMICKVKSPAVVPMAKPPADRLRKPKTTWAKPATISIKATCRKRSTVRPTRLKRCAMASRTSAKRCANRRCRRVAKATNPVAIRPMDRTIRIRIPWGVHPEPMVK